MQRRHSNVFGASFQRGAAVEAAKSTPPEEVATPEPEAAAAVGGGGLNDFVLLFHDILQRAQQERECTSVKLDSRVHGCMELQSISKRDNGVEKEFLRVKEGDYFGERKKAHHERSRLPNLPV